MICLDALKMPLLVLDEQINQKILSRNNDPIIVKILCAISALVVFFILVNEFVDTLTGKAIIG